MLAKTIFRLLAPFASAALVGGIIHYFGVPQRVSAMIGGVVTSPAVLLIIASAAGLIALCVMLALRLDERLYDIMSPIPAKGSFFYKEINGRTIRHTAPGNIDVDMIVDIENGNDFIVEFVGNLDGVMNGRRIQDEHSGFSPARQKTPIIYRFTEVPLGAEDGGTYKLSGHVRYEIRYFTKPDTRFRKTGKTIEFNTRIPMENAAGTHYMAVRFSDEIEE